VFIIKIFFCILSPDGKKILTILFNILNNDSFLDEGELKTPQSLESNTITGIFLVNQRFTISSYRQTLVLSPKSTSGASFDLQTILSLDIHQIISHCGRYGKSTISPTRKIANALIIFEDYGHILLTDDESNNLDILSLNAH
jgi:hypothetical protein